MYSLLTLPLYSRSLYYQNKASLASLLKFMACISGFIDAVTKLNPPPITGEFILFGREPGTGYEKDDTIVTLTMTNKQLPHGHTAELQRVGNCCRGTVKIFELE